jgi:transposase
MKRISINCSIKAVQIQGLWGDMLSTFITLKSKVSLLAKPLAITISSKRSIHVNMKRESQKVRTEIIRISEERCSKYELHSEKNRLIK